MWGKIKINKWAKYFIIVLLLISLISVSSLSIASTQINKEKITGKTTFSVTTVIGNVTRVAIEQTKKNFTQDEITEIQLTEVKASGEEFIKAEESRILNPKTPYELGFLSESFKPIQKLDNRIQAKVLEAKDNNTYGFIMISGLITQPKLDTLTSYGIKLLGPHPHHSYKAKIPLDKVEEIKNLPFVRWIGHSALKQKLHPNLFNTINVINNKIIINNSKRDQKIPVYINLFDDDNAKKILEEQSIHDKSKKYKHNQTGTLGKVLEQKGVEILNYDEDLKAYVGYATPKVISELIKLDFILNVEKEEILELTHDESTPSIGADYIRGGTYDGSGISVGIIGSGYEEDHVDLPSDTYCIDYVESDCNEDNGGSGTHAAGTIWGRGIANSKYKGVAPGITAIQIAKVVENDGTIYSQNLLDAMDYMAISPAADVVNLGVGQETTTCRGTDAYSRKVDSKVFSDNQIYVVSAGNGGPNSGSIYSPACAKNAITVGAVYDYGDGTIDDIASYSSRGPTTDYRKKPDVVAPGSVVTSTSYLDNTGYADMEGTSAAAPHVTGLVATLLEHYPAYKGDASRTKAALTARALVHGGSIFNVGNDYGMGKIESYSSHYGITGSNGWTIGIAEGSLSSSGNWAYLDITVPSDADRLVVVLTWHEPPASAGANYAVINDLDLYVDKGADQSGGNTGDWWSISSYDNKEYVLVNNPGGDTFRLKIYAYNIDPSVSPQDYDIAYTIIRGNPTPSTTLTETVSDTSVYVDEEFTVTAKLEPQSYIASGFYTKVNVPSGVSILSMQTTREDGVVMTYGSDNDINLGDIHVGDDRSVIWTLKATTTGVKPIGVYANSDNSGSGSTSIDVTVSEAEPDIRVVPTSLTFNV